MKKLFLMGRSEAGKTSLTQILSGEELHYHKTQYTNTGADIIDSPGRGSIRRPSGAGWGWPASPLRRTSWPC